MNANLIFTCLRDARYRPEPFEAVSAAAEETRFLPVEIIDGAEATAADEQDAASGAARTEPDGILEIDPAGGHRLRARGAFDAEALALLIRRLSA